MTETQAALPAQQIFCALPLRDVVIFPHMTTTILIGREKSVNSITEAKRLGLPIFAVSQTNPDHDEFEQKNIYPVGVLCNIIESIKTPDGTLKVIIQGMVRGSIKSIITPQNHFACEVDIIPDQHFSLEDKDLLGLIKACIETFQKYADHNKRIPQDTVMSLTKVTSPYNIAYLIVSYLNAPLQDRQEVLAELDIKKQLYKVLELIKTELEIAETEDRILRSIQEKVTKSHKEFYLNEQLKNIKKELLKIPFFVMILHKIEYISQ